MKKCKGVGRAQNNGCGKPIDKPFKYGLCRDCYKVWLFETDEGRKTLNYIKSKAHSEAVEKKQKAIWELYRKPSKKKTKLENMTFPQLKANTQFQACNPYIRERDEVNFGSCISSGNKIHDAGHRFSVGSNEALRFSPQNIHGQNRNDNGWLGGNTAKYDQGLTLRHGFDYLEELYQLDVDTSKKKILDKELVLRINKLYRYLLKNKIWVFKHSEFENYLKLMKL